ncbi:hypothetical protein F4818DRAFT_438644 [Hypoxylon cercidicola]|nr:hypothetical protein F4818DRAFT_438644 [Hypoxylon cercidicola]
MQSSALGAALQAEKSLGITLTLHLACLTRLSTNAASWASLDARIEGLVPYASANWLRDTHARGEDVDGFFVNRSLFRDLGEQTRGYASS